MFLHGGMIIYYNHISVFIYLHVRTIYMDWYPRSEANIIKKEDKLLGRFILYLTCKIWNKDTQYVVLKKHDILSILIPYFTRQI